VLDETAPIGCPRDNFGMAKISTFIVVMTSLALSAPSLAAAQGRGRGRGNVPIRFAEMDRNNDRVITRAEWNGSDRSFAVHDWNGDGVLSGDEVRVGAVRPRSTTERPFDWEEREYQFDDWTAQGFAGLDHNRDGRITSDEWHFDRESFRRADHNGDGVLSRAEFLSEDQIDDDRDDAFGYLDVNNDNRISRNEWHGTAERFNALDANRDGVITRLEMMGAAAPGELFVSLDVNHDRVITMDEWHWSRAAFNERDTDRNGRLTRQELSGFALQPASSAAFKAGQERGLIEGRQAGREDKQNTGVWDLEGQRELEQADSGYNPSMGPRAEYQAGYREAFRRGYREGFVGK
jgi:Ca2+-binding EF-hand superfamily protein